MRSAAGGMRRVCMDSPVAFESPGVFSRSFWLAGQHLTPLPPLPLRNPNGLPRDQPTTPQTLPTSPRPNLMMTAFRVTSMNARVWEETARTTKTSCRRVAYVATSGINKKHVFERPESEYEADSSSKDSSGGESSESNKEVESDSEEFRKALFPPPPSAPAERDAGPSTFVSDPGAGPSERKRGRGRPPGSKNKNKVNPEATELPRQMLAGEGRQQGASISKRTPLGGRMTSSRTTYTSSRAPSLGDSRPV